MFLITIVVSSLPDKPTRDDARAEAGRILGYVETRDTGALDAYFPASYPSGGSELIAECGALADKRQTVRVSGTPDFPTSFRITVNGVAKSDPAQVASCTFGLSRKDRHWVISAV
ncbi:hypothetical protein [Leifsonia sp. LS1]|uniref:hypothetical protein n=1 Tax=Leifsonia sp. LS1 TaxID=2828483 RepID=UPI001CFD19F2|nr:hypothetical protein [Leifsonia sp. LS1]